MATLLVKVRLKPCGIDSNRHHVAHSSFIRCTSFMPDAQKQLDSIVSTLRKEAKTQPLLPAQHRRLREVVLPDQSAFVQNRVNQVHASSRSVTPFVVPFLLLPSSSSPSSRLPKVRSSSSHMILVILIAFVTPSLLLLPSFPPPIALNSIVKGLTNYP